MAWWSRIANPFVVPAVLRTEERTLAVGSTWRDGLHRVDGAAAAGPTEGCRPDTRTCHRPTVGSPHNPPWRPDLSTQSTTRQGFSPAAEGPKQLLGFRSASRAAVGPFSQTRYRRDPVRMPMRKRSRVGHGNVERHQRQTVDAKQRHCDAGVDQAIGRIVVEG